MKTFDQLTTKQKTEMIDVAMYELVDLVIEGILEVNLVNPASQKRLEIILKRTRSLEHPMKLARLHIMNDAPIREELFKLAIVAASGAEYDEAGEPTKKVSENEIDQYFFREEQRGTGTSRLN